MKGILLNVVHRQVHKYIRQRRVALINVKCAREMRSPVSAH